MNHTQRDIAIYTQVAFKAAADRFQSKDLTNPEFQADFENDLVFLTDTLINMIEVAAAKHATEAAPVAVKKAPEYNGPRYDQNIGPSTEKVDAMINDFNLRVKGAQHGPIPPWAIKKAAELGVTEVWDNRDRLAENPRLPWFKSTAGDVPIWGPKAKGGK